MNVEIAERLARRRREAGYSQESLAERLGVTRQAVSKWERSESSPDTDNLIGLARLYGVSLDELLNVDPSLEDDVAFEAADKARAQERGEQARADQQQNAQGWDGQSEQNEQSGQGWQAARDGSKESAGSSDDEFKLTDDDGSYVHINWHDGVNLKDAKTGDEVHVGWSGIHIKESGEEKYSRHWGKVDGKAGCKTNDKTWDQSDAENSGCVDEAKIYGYAFGDSDEFFDKYHHTDIYRKSRAWFKFPIYVFAILAYLLVGFFAPPLVTAVGSISPWAYGIFLVAIIPTYYMLAHAIVRKGPLRFIQGFYPLACVVFFLWMWLIMGVPHPTWVVFLTVPIIEWICQAIRKSRRRKATVELS